MRVVVAPDSFGGTLTASEAAAAMIDGWRRERPDDELLATPLSDGGEGLLGVLHESVDGTFHELEVAGPHGKPVRARWLRHGATAYVESAEAAGLRHLPPDQRSPLRTTTYGVGQLLEDARGNGVRRVVVGLGGSATVDAGAGALTALGVRLLRDGGDGLKVGGGELRHLAAMERGWLASGWRDVEVVCWSDVRTALDEAAAVFGPQKGAGPEEVETLRRGLDRFADVVERDLGVAPTARKAYGTGAAGGLGYGLVAALDATFGDGAARVAAVVGLDDRLADADLAITGEGSIDATTLEGKVVGHVVERARSAGVDVVAVAGRLEGTSPIEVEQASPEGPGEDPAADVANAAARLAQRLT